MMTDCKNVASVFKALCDENRIRILQMLHGGELCACKLLETLNITQPTLSHHMKILCDNGIVNVRKEGKWSHYSYSDNIDITLINMISSIFTSQEDKQ